MHSTVLIIELDPSCASCAWRISGIASSRSFATVQTLAPPILNATFPASVRYDTFFAFAAQAICAATLSPIQLSGPR
jgi:hypothetical protein